MPPQNPILCLPELIIKKMARNSILCHHQKQKTCVNLRPYLRKSVGNLIKKGTPFEIPFFIKQANLSFLL